jgi:predicted SprT family Zn-dependent metalloprotease
MGLIELFLTMCLTVGNIQCDKVEVEYTEGDHFSRSNIIGKTILYKSGRMVLQFSPKFKNYTLTKRIGYMAHELAHLSLFVDGKIDNVHGKRFFNLCMKINAENKGKFKVGYKACQA